MKVSIFGLGYVGAVTAGCLTKVGHTVVGVDVQAEKVESLASGVSPIIEPELDGLLAEAAKNGLLSATQNHEQAIATTDVSLVCVGTPSAENGELNLQFVRQVTGQIADTVRVSGKSHDLVLRSTMLPGSTQKLPTTCSPICSGPANCASFFIRNFCAKAPRWPTSTTRRWSSLARTTAQRSRASCRPFSARTPLR